MKNKILLYLTFIGLIGGLVSCEDEGEKGYMLDNPIAPSIQTMPDLTLNRDNGTDTLVFIGAPVNPGFEASARYFLEAAAVGSSFADPVQVYSDVQVAAIKMTVSDLNSMLLKKFPADATSTVEFRLRSMLVVDAGTGASGTGSNPFEYISEAKTADVMLYGLPRLDLINSGMEQKIESPLGDGNYYGFVKLDDTQAFTLLNPDTDSEYGGSGGTLAVDGSGIQTGTSGWYQFSADINELAYTSDPYMIGLIGSATPSGWDTPDQKMDYDSRSGTWSITLDLVDGEIKFRKNDGWAWNLGGTEDSLVQGGDNIVVTAGNYTITLTIIDDTTGTYEIVENTVE
jgi:hypothetical protein